MYIFDSKLPNRDYWFYTFARSSRHAKGIHHKLEIIKQIDKIWILKWIPTNIVLIVLITLFPTDTTRKIQPNFRKQNVNKMQVVFNSSKRQCILQHLPLPSISACGYCEVPLLHIRLLYEYEEIPHLFG